MMVLDTNVLSELVKLAPDAAVLAFIRRQPAETLFTAAICEAEIRYGIARLPPGRRRDSLTARVTIFLETGFHGQILAFDSECAAQYGPFRHRREAAGHPVATPDAMIAATALAYGASAIVTRNRRDFDGSGMNVIDPWQGLPY